MFISWVAIKMAVFSSLATDLKSTIDYHKYEYWPVASANQEIDLDSLIVKGPFGILNEVSSTSTLSGYSLYNVNGAGDDLIPKFEFLSRVYRFQICLN